MDKNAIKKYAVWARRELIARVSQKALQYGISEGDCGDPEDDSVDGRVLTKAEKQQRQTLIRNIKTKGYEQVMEEVAYTWFNRFIALRFMEVNGYLPSHVRVFTDDQGAFKPQILTEAINLDLDGLDMEKVYALKDANKTDELYKYLLIVQCNALNPILPGMFQKIEDYTELLFPDNLLREGSVIDRMVRQGESDSIPESDWTDQVQIIGWLYQYYNTEPKDQVFADLKKNIKITKEKIPAATQLFTPDWIVRYMVENSLGRLWLEGHPAAGEKFLPVHNEDGSVRKEDGKWNYYLEEAPQEPEVEAQLAEIRREYAALTPEEIRVIDPCCGSGHILCYLFDVLEQIYEDYGYTAREAAQKIVQHNLHGLDIDPRAVQLSYFAVMMKARQYDHRFFSRNIQPMVYSPEGYPEGMEYGSLITVDELEPAPDFDNWTLHDGDYATALNRWSFRYVLYQKYHVVVTNPPYMAITNTNKALYAWITEAFALSKADLYSSFIQRCEQFSEVNGLYSMITQQSWLSLSSFEELRIQQFSNNTILNMPQIGARGFDEISGEVVSSSAFVILKKYVKKYKGQYIDLQAGQSESEKERDYFKRKQVYYVSQDSFSLIPNHVVVYNASELALEHFETDCPLCDFVIAKPGMQTSDNDRFLRFWHEICFSKIGFGLDHTTAMESPYKWFPYNKGIGFRKWYGNNDYVVNFYHDGEELKHWLVNNPKDPKTKHWSRNMRNYSSYFQDGITFTAIGNSFSARLNGKGYLFDTKGPMMFGRSLTVVCGFVNSIVFDYYNRMLCKQLTKTFDSVNLVPFSNQIVQHEAQIANVVNSSIALSKKDWNSFETSWDFKVHPFISTDRTHIDGAFAIASISHYYQEGPAPSCPLEACFLLWQKECNGRFLQLKQNEEELNRIFIDIYGLQDELTPEVEDKDVTVRKADLGRDIRSFISYAVGCMFGRYSIYKEGLIYAGGEWDYNQYEDLAWNAEGKPDTLQFHAAGTHFFPDQDNIIPITDDEYFHDDIVNRFMEFLCVVYGSDTLEENLKFIADALGGKGSPREVIRNYFLNDFYADHLKVYQKRPIYWLFDSGKKNGFKCLIYMHRYQPDTIARIRTDYVHELQSRYRTAIDELERRISDAATAERVKLNKQLAKLQAQADELRDYEEKIHHLADQMISIDLDDGVKVNYAKFQDVLAKIK